MAINLPANVQIKAGVTGQASVDSLRSSMAGLNSNVGALSKSFGSASAGLQNFVQLYVIDKGLQFVKGIINLGQELGNLAQITGVSASTLSALKTAGELNQVSFEQLEVGVKKFSVSLSLAQSGSQKQVDAFKAIGLEAANLKTVDQAIFSVADAFAKMKDGQDKARLAVDIFGKSGAALIPILNMGSVAIKQFGLDLGGNFVEKAKLFNQEIVLIGVQIQNSLVQGLSDVLPLMISFVAILSKMPASVKDSVSAFSLIGEAVRLLIEGFIVVGARITFFGDSYKTFGKTALDFFGLVKDGLIADLKNGIGSSDQLIDGFLARTKKRDDELLARTQKNLINTYATLDKIRGAEGAKVPGAKPGGVNDANIAETNRIEQAGIKFAKDKINLIYAENAALDLNNLQKKELQLDAEVENHGLKKTSKLYGQYIGQIHEALAAQEKLKEKPELGAKKALAEYLEQVHNFSDLTRNAVTQSLHSLEDAFVGFFKGQKDAWKNFADAIITEIIRIAVKKAIIAPLVDGIFGALGGAIPGVQSGKNGVGAGLGANFANGGIMSSSGPIPLKKYASGGIASSPQMSIFGEGSMNEAYVPLPDGKSIPVKGKLGGGDMFNITIHTDGTSTGDSTKGAALGQAISAAVKSEIINQKRSGGLLAS